MWIDSPMYMQLSHVIGHVYKTRKFWKSVQMTFLQRSGKFIKDEIGHVCRKKINFKLIKFLQLKKWVLVDWQTKNYRQSYGILFSISLFYLGPERQSFSYQQSNFWIFQFALDLPNLFVLPISNFFCIYDQNFRSSQLPQVFRLFQIDGLIARSSS